MDNKPKKKKPVDIQNQVHSIELETDGVYGLSYPEQDIPESKKTASWYVKNIRYISSYYNVPLQNVLSPTANIFTGDDNTSGSPVSFFDYPVNKILRNMQYYQGKQDNLQYSHWETQNVIQGNLQAEWIKGQDIAQLINHMKGNMLERISNIQITAKAMSEYAVSERQNYKTALLLKKKYPEVFNSMEQAGVSLNVGGGQEFQTEKDIDAFMDRDFKQYGVEVAVAMAKNFWTKSHALSKFIRSFVDVTIAGFCGVQHYVENGKQYMRTIPPYQMILDTRHDDDYNREAEFIGIVETMTPNEIFVKYPYLNSEQREEILKIAKSRDIGDQYNKGFSTFNWWSYNSQREACVVSVVTGYWKGLHDMRLKKQKNDFGDERFVRTPKDELSDYVVEDVMKATLIGNRYLVDWGYDDNIVEDMNDKSKPMFPIQVYAPNMIGGEPRSIVSRLASLQDELDALNFKIRDMVGKAKGRVYIIRGSVGNQIDIEQMYNNFAAMGMDVIPAASGENLPAQDSRLIEQLDYTLDPNIIRIQEIITIRREIMKEYTSISNVSLGMQTQYMGSGERTMAINQSSYGLAYLYHGFMDYIQINLQYALNVAKNLYTMDGNHEAAFVIGDGGVEYLKIMEDLKFEDFLVILQLNDVIDAEGRKEMQQLALGWAQNGILDPDVYLKVRKQDTFTGAERTLEYYMDKKRKKEEEMMIAQMQQEQKMQQQALQAQQQNIALQQGGMDNREAMKAESKIAAAQISSQNRNQPE